MSSEEAIKSQNPWLTILPVIFAAFMFVIDETIANVALPHMAGTFSASREESTWILTSYLVASGIVITAVDWFCRLMGRKNFFICSVVVFILSSIACGFSKSLEMMLAARILQGFGGGGLMPVAQAVLMESFPVEKRGRAMSVFGLVIVVAPIIGPVLGGWITDNFSWSWIFFINVPMGILTVILAKIFLFDPPYAAKQKNVRIDSIGFFLLTIWLVSLQVILDKGNDADWFNAPWICRLAVVCVISAVLFVWSQLKNKDSLIDLSVFKDLNFSIGTMIQIVIQGILLASLAVLPQFLQMMMGYTAYLSGLSMMPRGMGAVFALVLYNIFANKIDERLLAIIGLGLLGTAATKLGFLNLQISSMDIEIPNFIFGMGMAFAILPLVALSVVTLKNSQMTNAGGIQNLLKNIGGAIGTSIIATVISRYSQIHQSMLVHNLTPLNPAFTTKLQAIKNALSIYMNPSSADYAANYYIFGMLKQQASLLGFMEGFRMCALAAFIVIPFVFVIKKGPAKKKD